MWMTFLRFYKIFILRTTKKVVSIKNKACKSCVFKDLHRQVGQFMSRWVKGKMLDSDNGGLEKPGAVKLFREQIHQTKTRITLALSAFVY